MTDAKRVKKKEGFLKRLFTGLNKRPFLTMDEYYGIILQNTIAQSNAKILSKRIKEFSAKNEELIKKAKQRKSIKTV